MPRAAMAHTPFLHRGRGSSGSAGSRPRHALRWVLVLPTQLLLPMAVVVIVVMRMEEAALALAAVMVSRSSHVALMQR